MLRTFHVTNSNNNPTHSTEAIKQQQADHRQLNVSECHNGSQVIIGIDTGEHYAQIALNYQQFQQLCDLRYTIELTEQEESTQATLRAA